MPRNDVDIFINAKDRASGVFGRVGSSMRGLTGGLLKMVPALTAVGAGFAALSGIKAFIGTGVRMAADIEQARVAFTTLLGSADAANKMLRDLEQFASSTPFQLPGLTDAARSLAAFGVATEDVIPSLRRIGDVASGIGAPIGDIAEIYGKARVQGRLFAEDINQLTGRGIPIIGELAKQFGVTEAEVRKLVESGQVNFANLEQAFVSMTSEGGQFAGLMAAQSETLAGKWSTLKDQVGLLARDLGELLVPILKRGIDVLINMVGVIKNWRLAWQYSWTSIKLGLYGLWEDFKYIFTDQIPTALSNLWDWMKSGFEGGLSGLLDMPDAVVRTFTAKEAAMAAELADLGRRLGEAINGGMNDALGTNGASPPTGNTPTDPPQLPLVSDDETPEAPTIEVEPSPELTSLLTGGVSASIVRDPRSAGPGAVESRFLQRAAGFVSPEVDAIERAFATIERAQSRRDEQRKKVAEDTLRVLQEMSDRGGQFILSELN